MRLEASYVVFLPGREHVDIALGIFVCFLVPPTAL